MMTLVDIENAICARLRAAELGYTLRKIDSYGGEFDSAIGTLVRSFPAVLTICKGVTAQQSYNASAKVQATVTVFCCAANLRNEQAARHGEAGKIGVYQIMHDVVSLLLGQDLGLNIDRLRFNSVVPLMNDRAAGGLLSVYAVEFLTSFTIAGLSGGSVDAAELSGFKTFHADWDVPPHGNVQPPLPSADADASDTVTLPSEEPSDE